MSKDALTLFREGNPEEALTLLESLAVRHPKDPGQPIPKGLPIMQPGELISDFNNEWFKVYARNTLLRPRMQAMSAWLGGLGLLRGALSERLAMSSGK